MLCLHLRRVHIYIYIYITRTEKERREKFAIRTKVTPDKEPLLSKTDDEILNLDDAPRYTFLKLPIRKYSERHFLSCFRHKIVAEQHVAVFFIEKKVEGLNMIDCLCSSSIHFDSCVT